MLGKLVALSGCIKVWSHYGAEGRGRIQGEKPATTQGKLKSTREMLGVLNEYLVSQPRSISEKSLEAICRDNARKLIMHLQGEESGIPKIQRISGDPGTSKHV